MYNKVVQTNTLWLINLFSVNVPTEASIQIKILKKLSDFVDVDTF